MDEQMIRLEKFLRDNGASTSTISEAQLRQLKSIDDAIQNKLTIISKANKAIREAGINVDSISRASGISRTTFYNNPILKTYVESYSSRSTQATRDEIKRLKDENIQLKKENYALVSHDAQQIITKEERNYYLVQNEHLMNTVETYKDIIAEKTQALDDLQLKYDRLNDLVSETLPHSRIHRFN